MVKTAFDLYQRELLTLAIEPGCSLDCLQRQLIIFGNPYDVTVHSFQIADESRNRDTEAPVAMHVRSLL